MNWMMMMTMKTCDIETFSLFHKITNRVDGVDLVRAITFFSKLATAWQLLRVTD